MGIQLRLLSLAELLLRELLGYRVEGAQEEGKEDASSVPHTLLLPLEGR